MKYCSYCGKQISDEALFCPECGAKLPQVERQAVPDPAEPFPEYAAPKDNEYRESEYHIEAPAQAEPAEQRLTPLSIVGFVLAFVESLAGLIVSIIAYNKAKDSGNTRSQSFARTGIILSIVFLVLNVVLTIIFIVFFQDLLYDYISWLYGATTAIAANLS